MRRDHGMRPGPGVRRDHVVRRAPGMRREPGVRRPPTRARTAVTRVSAMAGLTLLTLAGCAKMNAALSQQWIDVSFKPGTSVTEVLRIRAACSHVPNVTAAPLHRKLPAIDIVNSVRYDTSKATNANVAELSQCLAKFPAAAGVTPQDSTDNGG
jgi:hypothetical protein